MKLTLSDLKKVIHEVIKEESSSQQYARKTRRVFEKEVKSYIGKTLDKNMAEKIINIGFDMANAEWQSGARDGFQK